MLFYKVEIKIPYLMSKWVCHEKNQHVTDTLFFINAITTKIMPAFEDIIGTQKYTILIHYSIVNSIFILTSNLCCSELTSTFKKCPGDISLLKKKMIKYYWFILFYAFLCIWLINVDKCIIDKFHIHIKCILTKCHAFNLLDHLFGIVFVLLQSCCYVI